MPQEIIAKLENGRVTVKLESMPRMPLIKWVLSDMGETELIRPASIRQELKNLSARLLELHGG